MARFYLCRARRGVLVGHPDQTLGQRRFIDQVRIAADQLPRPAHKPISELGTYGSSPYSLRDLYRPGGGQVVEDHPVIHKAAAKGKLTLEGPVIADTIAEAVQQLKPETVKSRDLSTAEQEAEQARKAAAEAAEQAAKAAAEAAKAQAKAEALTAHAAADGAAREASAAAEEATKGTKLAKAKTSPKKTMPQAGPSDGGSK